MRGQQYAAHASTAEILNVPQRLQDHDTSVRGVEGGEEGGYNHIVHCTI